MTLNELEREILALTFEDSLPSREAFISAANRALFEIHTERERKESLRIYKKSVKPCLHFEKISHTGGEIDEIKIQAKAISFTAVGVGTCVISDGLSTESVEFFGKESVVKRLINSDSATVRFEGGFNFDIYNFAAFDCLFGESEEDIELYTPSVSYDMKKLAPLFLGFVGLPENSAGEVIEEIKIEGSFVTVPREYEGEIIISYKRLPNKILQSDLDAPIDISEECSHLLALKCAAYLTLEDNEGLSDYYLNIYKNNMAVLNVYNKPRRASKYEDVLGWAK